MSKSPQKIKIFKSLNCPLCDEPYSPSSTDSHSPLQLYCGTTICRQCYNKEKPLLNGRRKHKCKYGDCFHLADPFYFLIELLSSDSFVRCTETNGYILQKEFDKPECPICQEDYTPTRAPLLLFCNHSLCFDCFFKARRNSEIFGGKFTIKCPMCQKEFGQVYDEVPLLKEFARELPQMIEQLSLTNSIKKATNGKLSTDISSIPSGSSVILIESSAPEEFECEACERKHQIEDMFYCENCKEDICGACGLRSHRDHKLDDFTQNEIKRLSDETHETLSIQLATYEYMIPKIQSNLSDKIEKLKELLLMKAEKIPSKQYKEAKMEKNYCKKMGDDFEEASEVYLPHLRGYEAKLEKMLRELDAKKVKVAASRKEST